MRVHRSRSRVCLGRANAGIWGRLKRDVEAIGFQQEVFPMMPARYCHPFKGAAGQRHLLWRVPILIYVHQHGMLEPSPEHGVRLVKVPARIGNLVGRDANDRPVDFECRAGWRADNRQFFCMRSRSQQHQRRQHERCIETVSPRRLHRRPPRALVMSRQSHSDE